ncbi:MAG: AMP-binding protein [Candidatus Bathyarchaeia archaeon]
MGVAGFKDYQLTVDKILRYALYVAPDQKLVYAPPNLPKVEFTYSEFAERVNRLGVALEHFGVKRAEKPWEMGTRVAVMGWNMIKFMELMYAVPMYGAVLYTVNIRLAPKEIIYTMNVAEPEVLFVHTDFTPNLNAILENVKSIRKVVIMSDEITCTGRRELPEIKVPQGVEVYEYEELLKKSGEGKYNWPELNEYVVACLFFTSGTTGLPKGVYHTHRQILLSSLQVLIASMEYPVRASSRDIVLVLPPIFHIFGWMKPYYCLIGGNEMVFPGRYEWAHITKLIKEYIPEAEKVGGIVIAEGVPTMLYSIIQEAKKMGVINLKGFKFVYGGEALPVSVYEDAKKMGAEIWTGYGPSETLTAITRASYIPRLWMKMGLDHEKLRDHFVVNNSLGVPVPLTLIKIVDSDGRELPMDGKTSGRLLFYAPSITREYYKDPEKTRRAWRYGLFDVDDIVVVDECGCVMFVDREKDAIKSGGEWIPSSRLEGFISTHPAVAEVAVIGVSHPQWVERPVALVVLKPEDRGKVTEDHISNHLVKEFVEKDVIPKWWVPDKIIFVSETPKTSTGKIDKKKLRARYEDF